MTSLDVTTADAASRPAPRAGRAPGGLPEPPNTTARRLRLRAMRGRATGLLVAVTAGFVAVHLFGSEATWVGYVQTMLEASMVGALADWFAVTALFRHPLGVPIPHTAVIPTRKDQFGETLGDFVQSSFLTPEIIGERVHQARVVPRTAAWMAEPRNAARVARHLADASVTVADMLRDEEVHRALEDAVRQRIEATPLAPVAGRTLELLTRDGRHQDVLDVALRALDRFLRENEHTLRTRFADEAPWWLPGAVEDRIFDRLIGGLAKLLHEVAEDPAHELRRTLDARARRLVVELQTSPEMLARGEELKAELLRQPELREWTAIVWRDLKAALRSQAADPDSELRRRLAGAIASVGRRLGEDPALAERAERAIETGVRYVADQFSDEIGGMVSGTVARWDGRETADRLELLLGPDLQFIRINGTVVGGLAGLIIHAVGQAL